MSIVHVNQEGGSDTLLKANYSILLIAGLVGSSATSFCQTQVDSCVPWKGKVNALSTLHSDSQGWLSTK